MSKKLDGEELLDAMCEYGPERASTDEVHRALKYLSAERRRGLLRIAELEEDKSVMRGIISNLDRMWRQCADEGGCNYDGLRAHLCPQTCAHVARERVERRPKP